MALALGLGHLADLQRAFVDLPLDLGQLLAPFLLVALFLGLHGDPAGTGGVPAPPSRTASQMTWTLTALGPLSLGSDSKLTFAPSGRVRKPSATIAEWWTNRSL